MLLHQELGAQVIATIRQLSGPANTFVEESLVLNALGGNANFGHMKLVLTSLVQSNKLQLFLPLMENLCGSGCGGGCSNGACGGGCCGCGRYYRVKIG